MEKFSKYSFCLKDLNLKRSSILDKTGSDFGSEVDHLISVLNELEASGGFSLFRSDLVNFSMGKRISRVFSKSQMIAVFVVTLGNGYKEISDRYRGDPLLYFLTDLIASEYTELSADYIHKKIAAVAEERSLNYSNRYSPGYCGWNTIEQIRLFSYLPLNSCGIRLTSSYLMDPVKSISGVVALGKSVNFRTYDCDHCGDEDCLYRKKYIL